MVANSKIITLRVMCFVLFLYLGFSLVAAQQLPATFEEGQTGALTVGGNTYTIEVLIIEDVSPATVTFRINGEVTGQLVEGSSQTLQDGTAMDILDIFLNEAGEAGSGDTVTFGFRYCGDNACNTDAENCGSCSQDCSCGSDEFCFADKWCEAIRCGDHRCSQGETCSADLCCDGKEFDFGINTNHCGGCGIQCDAQEACVEGLCVNKNSETIVEEPETLEEDETNVLEDQCIIATDCKDDNPCTEDQCVGIPKACSYQRNNGCVLEGICAIQGTIKDNTYCSVDNEWEQQKEGKVSCTEDYECANNNCHKGACFVKQNFLERVKSWFRLFTGDLEEEEPKETVVVIPPEESQQPEKVWFEIDPIQCKGNPWEQNVVYPNEQSEPQIIKAYYKKQGIEIFDLTQKATSDGVCEACSCPRGDTLSFLIFGKDVEKMKVLMSEFTDENGNHPLAQKFKVLGVGE